MTGSILIETSRLILRTVTLEDIEEVVSSWNLDGEPLSRQEAEAKVRWMVDNHARIAPGKIDHVCLAIIEKDTHEFIGWCGLDHIDKTKQVPVLFYLLKSSYWGKGLATEAAGALLDYAFRELELDRIDSGAEAGNIASKRVMEKIGMRCLGIDAEGGYAFMLTREEYIQRDKNGVTGLRLGNSS